ncbi:MAG TPA: helix-turn-helix transcriptional regulator [Pyrinomonadaceae bacterium]|jgi:transcriptional regulator with XRE-family HTH domain|nr:helix-turn-helix transcriptional regulator [Pyrinomonadaceae bacterium]
MGTKPRAKPERLAEKLRQIRLALRLSQAEMWRYLGVEDLIVFKQISAYELGKREPPLLILLEYARAANVYIDALVDDGVDLPKELPAGTKSEGNKRLGRPKR